MKRTKLALAVSLLAALALCLIPAMRVEASHATASTNTVGLLFSDFTTSARWVTDRADLTKDIQMSTQNVKITVEDAKTDQTRQEAEAKSLLTAGAKVLVVVPVDQVQAKSIVNDAHANKPAVPVVAYDRLIKDSRLDAYVTFNNFQVGVDQATWLVHHTKKGGTIVSIAGDPGDNNALLFHAGAMSVLKPLVKQGAFKLGYDKYTPKWDNATAQAEMASALNKLGNKVDGVLVANDGMAGGVIAALKAQHLAGKIPVTGQDATVAGLQNILLGTQGMTVYKPLAQEALATSKIVHLWLIGKKFQTVQHTNNGMINVPSVLLPVTLVTKANIKSTVLRDGFVTKAQLCANIPASACKGL